MSIQQENQEGQFEDEHQVIDMLRENGRIGKPVVPYRRVFNSISTRNSSTVTSNLSEVESLTSTERGLFPKLTLLN